MEKEYDIWKQKPTETHLDQVLTKARPVINSALKSYAGGDQTLEPRAKLLAAKAIKTYDPGKGAKLRTHMMTQMQPLVRLHRERTQVTRVPERVTTDLYKMRQEQQRFHDQFGRDPSDGELSSATGLARKRLMHIRRFQRGEMPESGMTDESGEILYPGISKIDPEQVLTEYVHHDLDPVDQMILEHRSGLYGKKILSNNEIAAKLKLSPGAISQRAAKIARRINDLREEGVTA